MKKCVNTIIIDKQNRLLVLKRNPNVKFSPSLWDLPGGKVENGETLQEAVKRETKEESNLDVEVRDSYFYIHHYPDVEIDIYAFEVELIGGEVKIDEEQHTEFRWISKDQIESLKYTPSVGATIREFFKNKF